jgi:hypothetical protein
MIDAEVNVISPTVALIVTELVLIVASTDVVPDM